MNTTSTELARLAALSGMDTAVTEAGVTIGAAIDAGLISLADVLQQVSSCHDHAELDGMLLALAADVALATGTMGGEL